jgi:O-antigen/teichoic acid export membrane protein
MSHSTTASPSAAKNGLPATEPDTPGMAARVVRGSFWNMGAQGAALLTSFVVTPFVIRILGTENYGLLALINLLIGYLGFADLGMGVASTKFGAEAFAKGDEGAESSVVWTSLLVTSIPAVLFASALVFAGGPLVAGVFGIVGHQQPVAVHSLRIAAVILLATAATGVFNTPQLVRLRIDLNSAVTMGSNFMQACLVLFMLSMGGRLVAVVWTMASVAVAASCTHTVISSRLSPGILHPKIDRALVPPLLRFGFGILCSALIGTLTVHGEKLLLVRLASISTLAHYNVAFTLASLLGMLPVAFSLSLIPGVVQLRASGDRARLQSLFSGMLRVIIFCTIPAALALCIVARPFLSLWAGPEFGRESAFPLYILACGWLFNSISYIPRGFLSAWDRVGLVARYQGLEVIPYFLAAVVLIRRAGIVGAAAVWGMRVVADSLLLLRAVRRVSGIHPNPLITNRMEYALSLAVLFVPVGLAHVATSSVPVMLAVTLLSVAAYGYLIVTRVLTNDERMWAMSFMRRLLPLRT